MKLKLRVPPGQRLDLVAGDVAREVCRAVAPGADAESTAGIFAAARHEVLDLLDRRGIEFPTLRDWQTFVSDLGVMIGARVEHLVPPEDVVVLYACDLPAAITAALDPVLEPDAPTARPAAAARPQGFAGGWRKA